MVGLSKSGRQLHTDPGFQISLEGEDDLLDFDRLGQAYSWTIQVPIKGNEWAFGYASDPARAKNMFKTYDDFAITWGGNVWWECSLDLLGVSDDGHYYEATLSTIDSAIFESKDKSIREIITATIPIGNGTYDEIIKTINEQIHSDVRFPYMHFYSEQPGTPFYLDLGGELGIQKQSPSSAVANLQPYYLIPAFPLHYVLKVTLKALGYEVRHSLLTPEVRRLLVHSNRPIDQTNLLLTSLDDVDFSNVGNVIDVRLYVPDLTLGELLKSAAFYLCSAINVTASTKEELQFRNIPIEFENAAGSMDLTDKVKKAIPSRPDISGIRLKYAFDSDLIKIRPLTGNYRGEFIHALNFDFASDLADGDYAFIRELNRYTVMKDVNGADWFKQKTLSIPYDLVEHGDTKEIKELAPALLPTALKARHTFSVHNVDFEVTNNGSGNMRINGLVPGGSEGRDIGWLREGENEDEFDYFFLAGVIEAAEDYMDLNIPFNTPFTIKKIVIGVPRNYLIPISQAKVYFPEVGRVDDSDFKGGILFWRGMQPDAVDVSYPFASADPYAVDGEEIPGALSLDTVSSASLVLDQWGRVYNFMKETRIVRLLDTALTTTKLKKLMDNKKTLRFLSGILRFRKFRVILTNKGIRDQEIEGYSI